MTNPRARVLYIYGGDESWQTLINAELDAIEAEARAPLEARIADLEAAVVTARERAEALEAALGDVNAAHQIEVSYHYERMDCSCGWQSGIRDYSQPEDDQWVERDWQNDHFLPLVVSLLAADEEALALLTRADQ